MGKKKRTQNGGGEGGPKPGVSESPSREKLAIAGVIAKLETQRKSYADRITEIKDRLPLNNLSDA